MEIMKELSRMLKIMSCSLNGMRWLDILRKLMCAAAVIAAACSAVKLVALCRENRCCK